MPLHWVVAPSGAHAAVSSNASCSGAPSLGSSSGREATPAAARTHAVPPRQPGTPPEREAPADRRGEQQHAPAAAPGGSSITPRTGAHGRCGAARLQFRGGSSSRPHPCAAAVACSYSRGWSMAVGARQGRGGSSSRPHPWPTARGRAGAAGRRAPTRAADAGEGREESGEVLTGGATRLLGGQGARRGGGEGRLQGESVGGGEGIRSRERQPGEGAGVGRNRAVNGRTGCRRR